MNTPTKLGAYALVLVAAFGTAAAVGSAVGPVSAETPHDSAHGETSRLDDAATHADHGGGAVDQAAADETPGGLMISEHGYTLSLERDTLPAGARTPVGFRVLGPDGEPVTSYTDTHDKDLHFIAVRRDMTGFQHVHPELGRDGTWRTPLTLTPGEWRVFADFTPVGSGEAMTLGADVSVAGAYAPRPLPEPSATARVDDYTVSLDGRLVPGAESEVTLTVGKDGRPVTDLQPYLAAYGHLVALRDGDLAYLHVHPAGEPGDGTTQPGPDITFYATAPSRGNYRLFLDFRHDGVVRTAAFTASAGADTTAGGGADDSRPGPDDDGHSH